MTKVSLSDLSAALMFVSSEYPAEAYVCRETGKVYWDGDEDEAVYDVGENPLPDDLDDPQKYVSVPDKRDLGLGTQLVFEFVKTNLLDQYDDVRVIFRRKGAYGRYKDLLEESGMLEQWYAFSDAEEKRVLLEWCEDNGFEAEVE